MKSAENAGETPVEIVHVARECVGAAVAGGVGDVVLQLAAQCVRQGFDTTIVIPCYGPFREKSIERMGAGLARALQAPEAQAVREAVGDFLVDMAYADAPTRRERVGVHSIAIRAGARLRLALIRAERFAGKDKPYVYSSCEAQAFAALDPAAETFCGAEPPPRDAPIAEGAGHYDYFAMNVLLQKAALELAERLGLRNPVFHCHDAHTALLPMLANKSEAYASFAGSRFLVTAHNCGTGYRQRCHDLQYVAAVAGLDRRDVEECVIEGEFDPLGAAGLYADYLTTVSDGYAWEVQGAWLSTSGGDSEVSALSEFLGRNNITIRGITNGIAPDIKGPEAQWEALEIARPQSAAFDWKQECKGRFIHQISREGFAARWGIGAKNQFGGLQAMPSDGCLFSFVGRWTGQKGVDIVARAAEEILRIHASAGLCVFGEGNEPFLLRNLKALVERFPGRVVVLKGFSERLAANIYAAGDFFLAPSRFEPCGLIDMIAQLNGNIPIVNQVGGLAKVADGVTGIGYFATNDRENLRGLVNSMRRALSLYAAPRELAEMQQAANRDVRENYRWETVFSRYAPLYGIDAEALRPRQAERQRPPAPAAAASAA